MPPTTYCLVAASLLILALFFRILSVSKCFPGSDVYGHLLLAKKLREQGGGPYSTVLLPFVGAEPHAQPLLWHWFVGRFNIQTVLRNQSWTNAILDAVFVPITFTVVLLGGYSVLVGVCAALTYLLTPMWFSNISLGPRIAGFTPRLGSELVTNIFLVICMIPMGPTGVSVTAAASVLAWIVISTSKFGLQALLFLTPLVSVISGNYLPLYAFVFGLLLTVMASRGKAITMFKTQLAHLSSYFRENLKRQLPVSNRNSFKALLTRGANLTLTQHLMHISQRLLRENSYTSVIIKMPVLIFVLMGMAQLLSLKASELQTPTVAPILAATILYLLINLRPLLFLGEAERYLNHVAVFISLFAAQYAVAYDLTWLLIGLWVYGAIFWLIEIVLNHKFIGKLQQQRISEDDRIIADLKNIRPTVVLAYPYQSVGGTFRIGLETHHLSVYTAEGAFIAIEFAQDFNRRYSEGYPFVKLSELDEMSERFGIEYVVVDRKSLKTRGIADWKPTANWLPRGIGGEVYDVYIHKHPDTAGTQSGKSN